MACVSPIRQRSGNLAYAVDVVVPGSSRKRINLGSVSKREAHRFCERVQAIEDAVRVGGQVERRDEEWMRNLPSEQYERVHRTGLLDRTTIPARLVTLNQWIDDWLGSVASRRSERTHDLYSQSASMFLGFIGREMSLSAVSRDHAARWNDHLAEQGLAIASIRRHIRQLKACFNAAINRDLLTSNPFDRIDSASIPAQRDRHVSADEGRAVLAQLPSAEYQALFALARFGGLRSPSETMILTWESVDLDAGRMEVYAPKTHQTRSVPIVADLRAALERLAVESDGMTGPLLTISAHNHPRTVQNAARRAGIEPWPRTFQTLRQSFSTSMAERFPEHVVAAWAGHSPEVSRRHYLTVRDEYFDDASQRSTWRSTLGRNEARLPENRGNGAASPRSGKSKQDSTLRNSPARIRTGDQAIMSPPRKGRISRVKPPVLMSSAAHRAAPDLEAQRVRLLQAWSVLDASDAVRVLRLAESLAEKCREGSDV